jgi:hypothetical protein
MTARDMASPAAYKVFGVPELGSAVMEHVPDVRDRRNVALTSKLFRAVVLRFLLGSVNMPNLNGGARPTGGLGTHTESLRVDMQRVHPVLHSVIERLIEGGKRIERSGECPYDNDLRRIRSDIDAVFEELRNTLTRTPRLCRLVAIDVPRGADLVLLLSQLRPDVESISLKAHDDDSVGMGIPTRAAEQAREGGASAEAIRRLVLWPVEKFDPPKLSQLRTLSLTNLVWKKDGTTDYTGALARLLASSPNLSYLELSLGLQERDYFAGDMMKRLSARYGEIGGQSLKLQTLKLGNGLYFGYPREKDHHLNTLMKLAELENLRLGTQHDTISSFVTTAPPLASVKVGLLKGLRRLSCQWDGGEALQQLALWAREYTENLSVRVADPIQGETTLTVTCEISRLGD